MYEPNFKQWNEFMPLMLCHVVKRGNFYMQIDSTYSWVKNRNTTEIQKQLDLDLLQLLGRQNGLRLSSRYLCPFGDGLYSKTVICNKHIFTLNSWNFTITFSCYIYIIMYIYIYQADTKLNSWKYFFKIFFSSDFLELPYYVHLIVMGMIMQNQD